MRTTHAGSSVADVVYMHSDVAFLFPIVPEAAFGAELLGLAASGKTNLRGGAVRVHSVQTYPDALDITKKAGPSAVVSVMTLAQGLPKMAANIRAASQQGQPLVVHVAGVEVSDEFELHASVGAAYELTDAGAAVVVAAGALDCVDSAIYAYVLADALRRPVIHLVDGPLGLSARTSAGLSWDAATSRIHAMHRQLGSSRPGMGPPLELGDFRALSFAGDRSARTVFVAIGTAISSARRAVESNSTLGLGLLAVQLLEPWHEDVRRPPALPHCLICRIAGVCFSASSFCGPAAANPMYPCPLQHFLDLLPPSTQLVVVLDYASRSRPLYERVRSAVARSSHFRAVASLSVEYTSTEDIDAARLLQLAASQGRGVSTGHAPISISQIPVASLGHGPTLAGATQYKLWWSPAAEKSQSEKLFGALSGGTGHVDCAGYHDVFHKAGHERTVTDVVVSSNPGLRLNHTIHRADMTVVYRTALLSEIDVFASLRDGGIALVNCPTNHLGAHRIVPADALQRNLQVYQVNAAEAGRICRTGERPSLRNTTYPPLTLSPVESCVMQLAAIFSYTIMWSLQMPT